VVDVVAALDREFDGVLGSDPDVAGGDSVIVG